MRDARKLKTWFGVAFVAMAFVLTGHRLALTQPGPNRLKFAHTFTTESERAILDAAVAEFERGHPGVKIVTSTGTGSRSSIASSVAGQWI